MSGDYKNTSPIRNAKRQTRNSPLKNNDLADTYFRKTFSHPEDEKFLRKSNFAFERTI